jgi:hypothetical protein
LAACKQIADRLLGDSLHLQKRQNRIEFKACR